MKAEIISWIVKKKQSPENCSTGRTLQDNAIRMQIFELVDAGTVNGERLSIICLICVENHCNH